MSVPSDVRAHLRLHLWEIADALGWTSLSAIDKARYYAMWTEDENIGGLLSCYIPKGRVHVYLKDTLLKDYASQRSEDDLVPRRVLGIPAEVSVIRIYTKPHGRWLADGRVICWGRADDWKPILMALYERTYGTLTSRPYAAVLQHAAGRFTEAQVRSMVEQAASRLGIEVVKWI